ncbi:methyltransferase domain-containing protein [Patescibacteria group bacterium]
MLYAFILGIHPDLSLLEIAAVFKVNGIDFELKESTKDFAVFEVEKEIEPQSFINQLGGTIRITEVDEIKLDDPIQEAAQFIAKNVQTESKFSFGVSAFGLNVTNKDLIGIKKELKQLNLKSRFVPYRKKDGVLSSVQVTKNNLLKDGVEIILLKGQKSYLGKTIAVQDFENYNKRDYGRPRRNPKAGMLPPKLAQMMINFGRGLTENDQPLLLDPFCGIGTVLQEATLLDLKSVGSDKDQAQVNSAKTNLGWFKKEFSIKETFKVIHASIEELFKQIDKNSFDLIVTEPYLGPPQERPLPEKLAQNVISQLVPLYIKSFGKFKKLLKEEGIVVIVFPVFRLENGEEMGLDLLDELKKIGYTPIEPSKRLLNKDGKELIYSRPNQIIKRQIMILQLSC